MLADGFKTRYTTIPFTIYTGYNERSANLFTHYHKETELIAITQGSAEFFIGADSYKMKEGEVLVIPPYSIHRAIMHEKTHHECICFDLSILWDNALRRDLEKGVLTVREHIDSSRPYADTVYNCVISAAEAYKRKAQGWEMQVIGNMSVVFGILNSESFFVKSGNADTDDSFVKKVMYYTKAHFTEPLTSSIVAESLFLNNSYFCRLFKKDFGCCFNEYLTSYRIERAKILLSTTDQSISDIAIKCGFNGFSYFSKTFKATEGKTPSEYRKINMPTESH